MKKECSKKKAAPTSRHAASAAAAAEQHDKRERYKNAASLRELYEKHFKKKRLCGGVHNPVGW